MIAFLLTVCCVTVVFVRNITQEEWYSMHQDHLSHICDDAGGGVNITLLLLQCTYFDLSITTVKNLHCWWERDKYGY
jgi:hypothetical protein